MYRCSVIFFTNRRVLFRKKINTSQTKQSSFQHLCGGVSSHTFLFNTCLTKTNTIFPCKICFFYIRSQNFIFIPDISDTCEIPGLKHDSNPYIDGKICGITTFFKVCQCLDVGGILWI